MKVGDLVIEKTRMTRKPDMGVILAVDYTIWAGGLMHPYQVYFFDGETNWMREGFLELIITK
jgi:hypothetical protein